MRITPTSQRRFFLIGGFLGAGKTTFIGNLVLHFQNQGLRCGLITNDQGEGLVDTVLARQRAAAVSEISGGCFCCRLDNLVTALQTLTESERPDVFLAEPVGSCTDLMATVLLPLRQYYQMPLELAPLSVLLDGKRAYQTLVSRTRSRDFSKDVGYIYRKQIEEAEIIAVNKIDLLTPAQLHKLVGELRESYSGRKVITVSAHSGEGTDLWLEAVQGLTSPAALMEVDYERYGEGEALLGWLNATIQFGEKQPKFEATEVLHTLSSEIVARLRKLRVNVAHFKMVLQDREGGTLRVQVTRNEEKPIFAGALNDSLCARNLFINLRAEANPDTLAKAVSGALFKTLKDFEHEITAFAHFKPGKPRPINRVVALA